MYKKYQEIYGESSASFETYRKVFDTENIGFSLPSAEECEICLEFQNHTKDSVHPPDDSAHCDICTKFPEHQKKYREARQEYQKEEESSRKEGFSIYTADMMKVFLLPKLTSKEHVFVSRMVIFNETFASLIQGKEHLAVLWY